MAFQPGRSYAFINFKEEEDAIHAMRSLQGFSVAGMPLKIEFAKAVSFVPSFSFVYTFICLCISCSVHYLYKGKSFRWQCLSQQQLHIFRPHLAQV